MHYFFCCVFVLCSSQSVRARAVILFSKFWFVGQQFKRLPNVYGCEVLAFYLGPRNLSPLKCIICLGNSIIQTSVSQAISLVCFLNSEKSGNAET